ncbi:WXG100 family type VII secretion target [Serinibacter salmoneus]|uniref:ESAT-6-like protein n=1 Tax=Serinibacter salmoneus TaxID=556530 RepID=A0A2A9D4G6_9MICO|nr:WXG100 family type VII secretion target [Serinibacter salmoneus]PFG21281.1 WXG100 family type VII secretion target [Serinibacter salmoneus]
MSENITVEFGRVAQAAGDIQAGVAALRARLEDMKGQLAAHEANWTGVASQAYRDVQLRWDNALVEMEQVLQAIGAATRASGENFQAREAANAAAWG